MRLNSSNLDRQNPKCKSPGYISEKLRDIEKKTMKKDLMIISRCLSKLPIGIKPWTIKQVHGCEIAKLKFKSPKKPSQRRRMINNVHISHVPIFVQTFQRHAKVVTPVVDVADVRD